MAEHDPWLDAQRLESWAGEVRVNFIRATGLVAFYGYHLLNFFGSREDVHGRFHAAVTVVVLLWAFITLVLHVCLSRRYVPPGLKYFSTGSDLLLIALMLILAQEGPRSPLMLLYFPVIASASLRLSLPLVYLATLGSMLAGVLVTGYQFFILIGRSDYYESSERVPHSWQIIYILALGATGLLAGQGVRQARRLVEGYTVAVDDTDGR
jgi:hypothetical protein